MFVFVSFQNTSEILKHLKNKKDEEKRM